MTSSNGARPRLFVGMGAVVFVALIVLGAGVLSFATDTDPIAVSGLGPIPGVAGIVAAVIAWVAVEATARRPGLGRAVLAGAVAATVHIVVVGIAVIGAGLGTSLAVAGHLVTGGFAVVTLIAGILAGTAVAVASRAGTGTPQWPWEKSDEDE